MLRLHGPAVLAGHQQARPIQCTVQHCSRLEHLEAYTSSSGYSCVGLPGIYALADPRDAEHIQTDRTHYVGQGIDWEKRAKDHQKRRLLATHNDDMQGWLGTLFERELVPQYRLLEEVNSKTYWDEHPERRGLGFSETCPLDNAEEWWIARGRELGWPLLNKRPGGNSTKHHTTTRVKISEKASRRFENPDARALISESRRNYYKKHPELLAQCGTAGGYHAHVYRREKPCARCRLAYSDYRGREPRKPAQCGTESGYDVHLRRREEPCAECAAAKLVASRIRGGHVPRRQASCGTPTGAAAHRRRDEKPCEKCRLAERAYEAEQRRVHGVPARGQVRCGTISGYSKHLKSGEAPCRPCMNASRDYAREARGGEAFKPAQCGTRSGYSKHRRKGEDPCDACRVAERSRKYRRKGSKPRVPAQCGTASGYARHRRLDEEPCDACRDAERARARARRKPVAR